MSVPHGPRKRLRLFWAQHGRCAGCNDFMDPEAAPPSPEYPTLDHVIPRSRGGTHEIGNLLLKHRRCNDAKADAPPTVHDLAWQAWVADRLALQPHDDAELAEQVDGILSSRAWLLGRVGRRRGRRGGWGALTAGLSPRLAGSFQFIPMREAS
jgi:hypothetical protein